MIKRCIQMLTAKKLRFGRMKLDVFSGTGAHACLRQVQAATTVRLLLAAARVISAGHPEAQ
jgi:hypothetical protein